MISELIEAIVFRRWCEFMPHGRYYSNYTF